LTESYRCWHDTWESAFRELAHEPEVYSDDFTRQHEVGAIFQDSECIALSFFRWIDLSSPINRQDSYFRAWTDADKEALCKEGTYVCISSNFTIAEGWRKSTVCSLKDVLVALIVERFLLSNASAVSGTVRNNRGVDRLIYRNGFLPIRHAAKQYGVDVDLAAFYRGASTRTPTNPVNEAIVQALKPKG
jgi:hypothetical protein